MDVKLQRNDVLREISVVQGVVETRTTIPILSNLLLEAVDGTLRLTATDLDMTVMTSCRAEVEQQGRMTVDNRVFQDLVRNLPEEDFRLRVDEQGLQIRSGRFESMMTIMDASEFPTVPDRPSGEGFELPLDLLQLMFSRVSFAITKEDPKYQLNGALLKFLPGELEVAATDGHRLAVARARYGEGEPPFERQLFPRKLVSEFSRFSDGAVVMSELENHLGFKIGERYLVARIVDLRFPDYERVIVRDNPLRAAVRREDLLASLRRVSLLAHEKARGVRFHFESTGELRLVSIGQELGRAEEILRIDYEGSPVEMAMNATYVMDVLGVLDCENVEFQLRDGDTQCLLVPVNDDERLEEYVYVLMPMRV